MDTPAEYTFTFYQSPKILIDTTDKNNIKIISQEDIEKGEILLCEHIICADAKDICDIILTNKKLFNDLYPRKSQYDDSMQITKDMMSEAASKYKNNASWEVGNIKNSRLGLTISKLNHSCNPNCDTIESPCDLMSLLNNSMNIGFTTVVSVKSIKKGEELTIMYNSQAGHESKLYDFKCSCTITPEMRSKIAELNNDSAIKSMENDKINNTTALSIFNKYITTNNFESIVTNQYMALFHDYYISDKNIYMKRRNVLYDGADENYLKHKQSFITKLKKAVVEYSLL